MQQTPKNLDKKRADEKLLVSEMIALYCRKQHDTPKGTLCPECRQLHDYALARIEKCPFMETKTFCSACKVHCYKPEMREKIRAVMRWAGPRMLPVHPVLSIRVLSLRRCRAAAHGALAPLGLPAAGLAWAALAAAVSVAPAGYLRGAAGGVPRIGQLKRTLRALLRKAALLHHANIAPIP